MVPVHFYYKTQFAISYVNFFRLKHSYLHKRKVVLQMFKRERSFSKMKI